MTSAPATERWWSRLEPALRKNYADVGPAHALAHAVRVAILAERISEREAVPVDLAVAASLVHDCGHGIAKLEGTDDHELHSARIAREMLADHFSETDIDAIADAVAARRFSKLQDSMSPLAEVLSDADNLDALGFSGVARAYMWVGEHGQSAPSAGGPLPVARQDYDALASHWKQKLGLLPGLMRTREGTRLAGDRQRAIATYLERLDQELNSMVAVEHGY